MKDQINRTAGKMISALGESEREVVFTRTFDAPRELVWKAWTEPARMAQWWGPHTFTNLVCEMDVRPGGAYRIVMRSPDGTDYPVKGLFLEVEEPHRLVMTDLSDDHPAEWHEVLNEYRGAGEGSTIKLLWIITFSEEGDKTTISILSRFDSVEDRDALIKMGMTDGWAESLEKLEVLLAQG